MFSEEDNIVFTIEETANPDTINNGNDDNNPNALTLYDEDKLCAMRIDYQENFLLNNLKKIAKYYNILYKK